MATYKQIIEDAMNSARYRLGNETTKEASAQSSLVKEASDLADALEYMSYTIESAGDSSTVARAKSEMLANFHSKEASRSLSSTKTAGRLQNMLSVSATSVAGEQGQAPTASGYGLANKSPAGQKPVVTSSMDSTGNPVLDSYKQANSGQTLYDILMHNKEAGDVGEYTADQYMSIPSKNENANRSLLNDASILSGVSKREAKATVRARLQEAFAHTSDTVGDQTVSAIFPQAYQKGGLKKV